jgi:tetratricopeptide (TPR) repeat protein
LWAIIGVTVAVIGLIVFFAALFLRKVRLKKEIRVLRWATKKDKQERFLRVCTYLGLIIATLGVFITLIFWVIDQETKQRIQRIEKQVKEANENIKQIEDHFGIQIYTDGLTEADPPVFDPFVKGLKRMREYKWDETIAEFKQSMKEAKASQLVALYNLIGLCYDRSGKFDLALESYNKSLALAKEFNDKEGEAGNLGNLGLIFKIRGDLEKALKYHEDALKIEREIGNKEGEATVLNNLGLIFRTRGDLAKALEYHEDALKID